MYKKTLSIKQTEIAIKEIKDFFQLSLSTNLNLTRVTAPIFVKKNSGINDDLNGVEKPVSFKIKNLNNLEVEIVQSLAKWKRLKLSEYKIIEGQGIYTDMNALRPDDEISSIHSIYVDQWDWEKVIVKEQRSINYLKQVVKKIYNSLKQTEFYVSEHYEFVDLILPDEIFFIHAEELLKRYPTLTAKERETEIVKEKKAVFIIGIGNKLENGEPHDGRAADYDDWTTETINGYKGLNGDIVIWNPVLKRAFEISSMGIRVDKKALEKQLKLTNTEDRKKYYFHKKLLNNELPLSIGGGIGQSRLCMYFLRKKHIGEVQSSIWNEEIIKDACENKIDLL